MLNPFEKIAPPTSETELLQCATALTGLTLAQAAAACGQVVPNTLLRDKGWVGQLLEICLGASAACLAEPDFQLLGIELKTLPLNKAGLPKESTYVATVPLLEMSYQTWRSSNVWRKLAKVLWIPIEAEATIPVAERRIGKPLLWSPDAIIEAQLQQDWEEFAELISLGEIESITARQGTYLQIRPKAAHSRVVATAIGTTGEKILTLPRGFYLRPGFTRQLLENNFIS